MRGRQSARTLGLSTEWGFREDESLNNIILLCRNSAHKDLVTCPKKHGKVAKPTNPSPPSPVQSRCLQAPTRTAWPVPFPHWRLLILSDSPMWSLVSQARLTLSGSFSSHTTPFFLRDRVDEEGTELRTRRYARSAPDKSRSPALQSSVSTLACTLTKEARTLELDEEGVMGDTVHSSKTGAPSAVRMTNCGFRPNCVDCGSRLIPTKKTELKKRPIIMRLKVESGKGEAAWIL